MAFSAYAAHVLDLVPQEVVGNGQFSPIEMMSVIGRPVTNDAVMDSGAIWIARPHFLPPFAL